MNKNKYMKLFVEITSDCNHDCVYCYFYRNRSNIIKRHLNFEQLDIIVEKLKIYISNNPHQTIEIIISGGEPFASKKEVFYLIEKIYPLKDVRISINTNILLLNENDIKEMIQYDVTLFVSLPTYNEKTYEEITGVNDLEKLKENLDLLVKNKIRFTANLVASKLNITQIVNTCLIYSLSGGKTLTITHANFNKESCNSVGKPVNVALDKEDRYNLIQLTEKLSKMKILEDIKFSYMFEPCQYDLDQKDTIFCCATAGPVIFIDVDGTILPCGHFPFENNKFGNIFTGNLEDCINNAKQYKLCNTSALPQECVDCKLKNYCNGGCGHESYNNISDIINELKIKNHDDFLNFCELNKNGNDFTNNFKFIEENLIPSYELLKYKGKD